MVRQSILDIKDMAYAFRNIIEDVRFLVLGKKLKFVEGVNSSFGVSTLSAGTVTVTTTAVNTNSRVFLTEQPGGSAFGFLRISTITNGVSFVITSSNAGADGNVAWIIIDKV